ncbi:peroxisomal biogenesis factor 11-domain-containing protein [Chaetomium sp. MPI-SDFR-AT-0129]|nr:peroxisomal biogenesis factor 11-domain-containing protein [Chaetomium sp. MPI-SDFR-AT-0129]
MAVGISAFEQLVKFGTDAYGIERLLRLIQSLITILLFAPTSLNHLPLLSLLIPASFISPTASTTTTTLTHLRKRLATLRQPLRFFRFLDCFASAWTIFTTTTTATPSLADTLLRWTDFGSKAFNGMYLLLESAVFAEAVLDVPGVGLWVGGPEAVKRMGLDGQRFWFVSLVCGIVGGVVKLMVSETGGQEGGSGGKEDGDGKGKEGSVKSVQKKWKVLRRVVADMMDLAVPGSAVGWVPLSPGMVGVLMFGSTVLTGLEVWERCGRELAVSKAAGRS